MAMSQQESQEIALLQQTVDSIASSLRDTRDSQKSENDDIWREVNAAKQQLAENKGAKGLISFIVPVIIVFGGGMISTLLWNNIQTNQSAINEHSISLEQKEQRVSVLEATKPARTSGIWNEMTDMNARLKAIEKDLAADGIRFDRMAEDIVSLQARTASTKSTVREHEEELDDAEDKIARTERGLSGIQASTQASFVEVETQLRSLNDVYNLRFQEQHKIDTILWQHSFETDLPEQDFHPTNIPAKATSSVGEIKRHAD